MYRLTVLLLFLALLCCSSCRKAEPEAERTVAMAAGGRVKTLDPALADDVASRNMAAALYDTLLEYDYTARPYKLIPSMLECMPEISPDGLEYRFKLRDDLFFAPDKCFKGKKRKITSDDVFYSFKRIADSRLHSPAYWMFRGKIAGLTEFYHNSAQGEATDYDFPVSGMGKLNDREFIIRLTKPDPRFLCILALPNTAVVPREAVEFYGTEFAVHPVGSGAFILKNWVRDCRIELRRNEDFRTQYFT